jgi:uncharacterized protein
LDECDFGEHTVNGKLPNVILAIMIRNPFVFKLKSTKGTPYVYDVNSNEFLRVDEKFFCLIDDPNIQDFSALQKKWASRYSAGTLRSFLAQLARWQKKGLFLPPVKTIMQSNICDDCFNEKKLASPGKLTLEITCDCNMRCRYCGYSGCYSFRRKHYEKEMPLTMAKEAISKYLAWIKGSPQYAISFYGGEPFLAFGKIRELIEFSKSIDTDNKAIYHIATNGTILSKEIIRYLIGNRIMLQVSIDGPSRIHDRYRVFKNGKPTHATIIKNLKRIMQIDHEYYKTYVSFAATLTPPFELEDISNYFEHDIFSGTTVMLTMIDSKDTTFFAKYGISDGYIESLMLQEDRMRDQYVEKMMRNAHISKLEAFRFERNMIFIHKRERKRLEGTINANGICIPGIRRCFINVNGNIYPCERVGSAFKLGTVDKWIKRERIYELIGAYIEGSEKECSTCWAMRLCDLCFAAAEKENRFDFDRKKRSCEAKRYDLAKSLVAYVSILESNATAFDKFKHMNVG